MLVGTALYVRLMVYMGLSLFIIRRAYMYLVVCVFTRITLQHTVAVAVCWGGMVPACEGVSACRGCVYLPRRCLPARGMSAFQGVSTGGGGFVCLPGGCLTQFLTHACENITFPQFRLRTVIIKFFYNKFSK